MSKTYTFIGIKGGNADMAELRTCPACGAGISKESQKNKMCEYCGTILSTSDIISDSRIHTLTIIRKNQFALINPAAKVYLNGQHICDIKNASNITTEVEEGVYLLECSFMKFTASLNINIKSNKSVILWWDRITGLPKLKIMT